MLRIYDLKNFKVIEEVEYRLTECVMKETIDSFTTKGHHYIGSWKCCTLVVDYSKESYTVYLRQYKASRLLLLAEPGTDVSKILPGVEYMILTEKTSGRLYAEPPATDMQSMQQAG